MNYQHPALLDKLAAEYVLGTLSGGARRRFETLLNESHAARISVQGWENRIQMLSNSIPPVAPNKQVWDKIYQRIQPTSPNKDWWRMLIPVATFASGLLITVGILIQNPGWLNLQPRPTTLPASYVGFLYDANHAPLLITSALRHGKTLSIKWLKPITSLPAEAQLTLWAIPADGKPFLVGQIPPTGKADLTLSEPAEKIFFKVNKLALTKDGRAPNAENTLFSGDCAKFW
ncbi:anti-sigma factor [Parvibium lacunae]|uniref:RNA polymerase subunit sigma-70 n=1 Tax=Parvibium lacunae TaxID=1888893 RepID=A0A368L846_9BURK|nr:hypothetical protein [Parvibium lacunae]RCS59681.1 hypothetical protein DU000_02950 [Parvibium lacunae]